MTKASRFVKPDQTIHLRSWTRSGTGVNYCNGSPASTTTGNEAKVTCTACVGKWNNAKRIKRA